MPQPPVRRLVTALDRDIVARVLLGPVPLFEHMDVIYEMCRLSGLKVYPL